MANFTDFLSNAQLSTANYNNLLVKWSDLTLKSTVTFDGGNSKYDLGLPAVKRQKIISSFTWTITDGGETGNWYELPTGLYSEVLSTSSIKWEWDLSAPATYY